MVLSGGGARGAYQAGVLRAIAEISGTLGHDCAIPIITGVSAGAVNAAYLAAMSDDMTEATDKMALMWTRMTTDRVFRTDAVSAGWSGLRLFTDATMGAFYKRKLARSLLDTAPLHRFLNETIPFDRIGKNLENGCAEALAVTAMRYTDSTSITFIQSHKEVPAWTRSRRRSEFGPIGADHVMASSAIPLFFPPVRIEGGEHFGDGCLRNTAPLSPAVHLGAEKILVISVRKPDSRVPNGKDILEPSMARILGVILNALLLDSIDVDMERMSRVNHTIDLIPEQQRQDLQLRKVEYLWLRPSRDIGHLAGDLFDRLPRVMRYLVGGLGTSKEAAELTSYLLFDPDFCGQLVHWGYEDGMAQRAEIEAFLQ